jgi:hypothetical protein
LLVFLRFEWKSHALDVATVQSTGSPSAPRPQSRSTLVPPDVNGNAPWALSALPECFEQVLSAHGPAAYVLSQLPPGSQAVRGPAELRNADCRLEIRPNVATVERGAERLVIPPVTQFYRWPDRIGFVHRAGKRAARLSLAGRLEDRADSAGVEERAVACGVS